MSYSWEGDLILQDTVIEKKRFFIGSQNKPIKTDIREWISFEDNNIMKGILRELVRIKRKDWCRVYNIDKSPQTLGANVE
ncbi:MAG: hypothetical protein AB1638_13635 [Nitrospirota bacterium]